MPKIQNIACFEFAIYAGQNQISLEKINLKDEIIHAVYLFCSTEDVHLFSPVSTNQVSPLGEIGPYGFFLNLFDERGLHFMQDFASDNLTIQSEMEHYIPYQISRKIDWQKSFLRTILPEASMPLNILLYVLYENGIDFPLTQSGSAFQTVEYCPSEDFQDFCLKDCFSDINGKTVLEIKVSGKCTGYFDLCGENNRLENIPAHFFEMKQPKDFQIEPFQIDVEKSFYRHRSFSRQPFSFTLRYEL